MDDLFIVSTVIQILSVLLTKEGTVCPLSPLLCPWNLPARLAGAPPPLHPLKRPQVAVAATVSMRGGAWAT